MTEDAPAYGVLAGLRALRAAGHEVWLAITNARGYGLRSRARAGLVPVPAPDTCPGAYVVALADAAERLGVAAVLPGTERGLVALSERGTSFPAGIAVGAGAPAVVRLACDKRRLDELAREAGLNTPPTWLLTDRIGAEQIPIPFPAVVKLAGAADDVRARASRPVRRVADVGELLDTLEALPGDAWLVQPYLAGRLTAVSGVAWNGEVICAVHQVAERIYPPDCGISAYAMTVAPDGELEEGVSRLIGRLAWSGIFQAQFLHSGAERYLIDLNPRMYGSLALAVAAGLNLPAIWAGLLLGEHPTTGPYRVGVRFRSEERDAGALVAALMAGDLRTAARGLVPRRNTVHAVFSVRDPLPTLRSLGQLAQVPGLIARNHRR